VTRARRELAIVIGSIGKLPYAGMAYYWWHHIRGLQELGYEVHYLERLDRPLDAYDPGRNEMTDDPSYAVAYLNRLAARLELPRERLSFVDLDGTCHISGWKSLEEALKTATFILNVSVPTWFDALEQCERRLYVDGDPMFTQVAMVSGEGSRADPPRHYDTLFTYATRIGADDCLVPDAGRTWIAARPVVATGLWHVRPIPPDAPVVGLMHWAAGRELELDGRSYGHKDREFARFAGLPEATGGRFVLAVGGKRAPRDELERAGWEIADPLAATGSIDSYQRFIAAAGADLGIAKHAYVATRSGWFSDRSTCFLAAGRPVLHQDTGYTDWLHVADGVLPFSDLDSLISALERLRRDYAAHAAAARRVAEEHFEARTALAWMLEQAGIR
jgi:hypothetical protein